MGQSLVVVESPAKARTIGRYLGQDVTVMASMGHVRDLPESSLGVDVAAGFEPVYVLTRNGKKVSAALRKAAAGADDVFLATDPDREGEAIAWHVMEVLKTVAKKARFHRVTFHEITPAAIQASFEHPGEISEERVAAQQARRVLDRLVGYQVSPMLWKGVRKGTSAGRVQSVALRLVVEREREILAFEPQEYWNLGAIFDASEPPARLETRLAVLDGETPNIKDAATANALAQELENAAFVVSAVTSKPRQQRAKPPFITSTLQQAAGSHLRYSTTQTMRIAQQLYEGIDIGKGDSVGLITYMRTDSVVVSKDAERQASEYIAAAYGREYVPAKPNRYRSSKAAQEAHEAIRPTDVTRTPESVATCLNGQQLKLYRLIWNRFVASQMAPAKQMDHTIEVLASGSHLVHSYTFRATARETLFPGYLKVYDVKEADEEADPTSGHRLPPLQQGTPCTLQDLSQEQCFTAPAHRFSEATLVKALEQNGVGRPSTYAATVNTIQERDYVQKEKSRLLPTELGFNVNDFLVGRMPDLFDVGFTASMEAELDRVEGGDVNWVDMLGTFYARFREWVDVEGAPTIPGLTEVATFLDSFPADLAWAPPTRRGRRTFDDKEFHASLLEQVRTAEKALSERQWKALLAMAARYSEACPALVEAAATLGAAEAIRALATAQKEADAAPTEPNPGDLRLIAILAGVTWDPPVTRGKRTYDDARFFRSLKRQVDAGSTLSEAQLNSLKRLIVKYAAQIEDIEAIRKELGLEDGSAEGKAQADPAKSGLAQGLVALAQGIETWEPPVTRGSRTYDDREFVSSLERQLQRKGELSDRQIQALRKVLAKYEGQLPNYAEKTAALGLVEPAAAPKPVDATCPECGEPLVQRTSRRKGTTFYGCTAFPKCRFLSNDLPAPKE